MPHPNPQVDDDPDFGNGFTITPQCINCIHFRQDAPLTCEAFPNGIPMVIFLNEFDHRRPWPGDGNLRYIPITPAKHPMQGMEADPENG